MENNQDIIQAYLNKQLSEEDTIAFEKRLKNDQNLAEEVIYFKEVNTLFKQKDLISVISTVRKIREEVVIEPDFDFDASFEPNIISKGGGSLLRFWWLGAIGLSLAIVLVIWINQSKVSQNFSPYKKLSTELLSDSSAHFEDLIGIQDNSPLSRAMSLYGQRNSDGYRAAIPLFEQYQSQKNDSASDFPDLYLAICHTQIGQTEAAQKILTPLQNSDIQSIANAAKWYLAVCYLQVGQSESAKTLFYTLKDDFIFGNLAKTAIAKLGDK